jgi:hypothetical protein
MFASAAGQWPLAPLAELAQMNPRRATLAGRADETPTTFIPMPAVDDRLGTITQPQMRSYSQVKKGYTYFEEGDVIFAKITPCMQNGKHAIARGLIDGVGFGSTEFHVLRPGPELQASWLHAYLRQPRILAEATRHFTGAVGQQRVPTEFLADLKIPRPPIDIQTVQMQQVNSKISAVSDAADSLAKQLDTINAISSALLRRAFSGGFTTQLATTTVPTMPSSPHSVSKEARANVLAYLVNYTHGKSNRYRTILAKDLFLTEAHVGAPLKGEYIRQAAGPLASDFYDLERLAVQQQWIIIRQHKGGHQKKKVLYQPGPKITQAVEAAKLLLRDHIDQVNNMLDLLASQDTWHTEMIATLFAAWNDLLLDKHAPSDEEIIHEVRENWHPDKHKFSLQELLAKLTWMREKNMVPKGIKPHTRPLHT